MNLNISRIKWITIKEKSNLPYNSIRDVTARDRLMCIGHGTTNEHRQNSGCRSALDTQL